MIPEACAIHVLVSTAIVLATASATAPAQPPKEPPADALSIEISTGDGESEATVTRALILGRRLLIEPPEDPRVRVIFDGQEQAVHILNEGERTHAELSAGTLELIASAIHRQLRDSVTRLEQGLERLPPEERAGVEARLREQLERLEALAEPQDPPPLEVIETSRADEVDSTGCDWHELRRAGELLRELCIVPWAGTGFSADRLQVARDLGEFSERVLAGLPAGVALAGLDGPFLGWQRLAGLPLRVRVHSPGDAEPGREEVVELIVRVEAAGPVDPARFEVPPGLTRVGLVRVD